MSMKNSSRHIRTQFQANKTRTTVFENVNMICSMLKCNNNTCNICITAKQNQHNPKMSWPKHIKTAYTGKMSDLYTWRITGVLHSTKKI